MINKCEQCEKEFETKRKDKRFCCDKCQHKHRYENPKFNKCLCVNCGNEFTPKAADRNKYCSRECAFEHKKAKPKEKKEKVKTICLCICVICNKEFNGTRSDSKYCSDECSKEMNRRKELARSKERHEALGKKCQCKQCGIEFIPKYGSKHRSFCTDLCSKRHGHKQSKRKRKAILKKVEHVPYSDNYIFKRDKWICHLCGEKVDPQYTGNHPMAASIDHLIPISLGGADAPYNVKLAHRKCNMAKGNRSYENKPEQLLIFG